MAGRGSAAGQPLSPEKRRKQQNRPVRGTKHDPAAASFRSGAASAASGSTWKEGATSGAASTLAGFPSAPGSVHPDAASPSIGSPEAAGIGATGSPGAGRPGGSFRSPAAASAHGVVSSPGPGAVSHPLRGESGCVGRGVPTSPGARGPGASSPPHPSAAGLCTSAASSPAPPGNAAMSCSPHGMEGSPPAATSSHAAGSWRTPERRAQLDAARRAEVRRNLLPFMVSSMAGLSLLYFVWSRLTRAVLVTRPPESDVPMANFSSWAAVSVKECSEVARRVFGERGTVGDAAVALTLCSCVAMPMYCGPGGGMVALYYRKSTGKTWFVDGREKSPSAASKSFYKPGNSSVRSVLSIAVPGQMRGLAKLLELTGNNVPWRALFKEAIDLASKGFEVSPAVAQMIALHDHVISSSRALRTVFKPGGTALKAGSKLRQEKMAQTLYELASQGRAGYFYEEHYAKAWLAEITSIGSLMKIQDVKSYEARALPAVTMELQDNITLVTSPPPTTGAITAAIFGIVEQWYQSRELHDDASFLHVLAEAFKFGFGRRSWFGDYNETDHKVLMTLTDRAYTSGLAKRIRRTTVLPPSQYAEEFSADTTEGTAPILLSAPNGDVVGLVSSINSIFGSAVMSELTGIIFNNVMNDFDIPGQTNVWGFPGSRSLNQLEPNRRPVSSLAPVFLFRNGKFLAAAVGTGGGKAITGTAQVLLRVLKMKRTLKEAVDWYRVHHQLVPDTLLVESTIDYGKRAFLSSCLHNIETLYKWPGNVLALSQEDGRVYAMYDHRSTHLANTVDGI